MTQFINVLLYITVIIFFYAVCKGDKNNNDKHDRHFK